MWRGDSAALEAVCGHTGNCTVTWPLGDRPETICERCYQTRLPQLKRAQREVHPVTSSECAFGCGTSGVVRYYEDMGMSVCDGCVDQSERALAAAEAAHIPRSDIVPDCVLPGVLFVGAKESAYNRSTLSSLNISRILVCCSALPLYHSSDLQLRYHRIPIQDSVTQSLREFLPSAMAFIAQGAEQGQQTLVHCNAGASRSGAIAVAYISGSLRLSIPEALTYAKSKRAVISPNSGFLRQLGNL